MFRNRCTVGPRGSSYPLVDILHAMSVIPITVFLSLLLAGLFVVLFAREQRKRSFASAERESLLPLADETPRVAKNDTPGLASH